MVTHCGGTKVMFRINCKQSNHVFTGPCILGVSESSLMWFLWSGQKEVAPFPAGKSGGF